MKKLISFRHGNIGDFLISNRQICYGRKIIIDALLFREIVKDARRDNHTKNPEKDKTSAVIRYVDTKKSTDRKSTRLNSSH